MFTGKSIETETGRNKTAELGYEELKNRLRLRIRRACRVMAQHSGIQTEVLRPERSASSCKAGRTEPRRGGAIFSIEWTRVLKSLDRKAVMRGASHRGPGIMKYRTIKPLIVEAVQVSGPADVPSAGGILHAAAGDWIIVDPQGNVRLCHDAYFRVNYTSLKTSTSLDQFREKTSRGGC